MTLFERDLTRGILYHAFQRHNECSQLLLYGHVGVLCTQESLSTVSVFSLRTPDDQSGVSVDINRKRYDTLPSKAVDQATGATIELIAPARCTQECQSHLTYLRWK